MNFDFLTKPFTRNADDQQARLAHASLTEVDDMLALSEGAYSLGIEQLPHLTDDSQTTLSARTEQSLADIDPQNAARLAEAANFRLH